jgi:hypothetical protein
MSSLATRLARKKTRKLKRYPDKRLARGSRRPAFTGCATARDGSPHAHHRAVARRLRQLQRAADNRTQRLFATRPETTARG